MFAYTRQWNKLFTVHAISMVAIFVYSLADAPVIGFEPSNNGRLLAIREGEMLELCVVLLSGSLTFETVIQFFAIGGQGILNFATDGPAIGIRNDYHDCHSENLIIIVLIR